MSQCMSRQINAIVAIEGEHVRLVTRVNVDNFESGERGIGSHVATKEAVKAFAGRKITGTAR